VQTSEDFSINDQLNLSKYLEFLYEEMNDMSPKEFNIRGEICRRYIALTKLDPYKSIYEKNKFLKKSNFPKWFPLSLRDNVIKLANENKIGLVIRLCPAEVIKKLFTDYQLKAYWQSLYKRTKGLRDVELAWFITLPLYCYILAHHEKRKVNKLTNLEYKEKIQSISRKSKELFDSINELDCDLNVIDLFLRNKEDSTENLPEMRNSIAGLLSNRTKLSDVLHFYSTITNNMKESHEYVLSRPNIKHAKETYFVKVFCKFNVDYFDAPFHQHTMNIVNIIFDREYSLENIRSKTKTIRKKNTNVVFINDDFKDDCDLVGTFIDKDCNNLSDQFFIHPLTFSVYKDFDCMQDYDQLEVDKRAFESFVAGENYDLDHKMKHSGTYRLEIIGRKIHSTDEEE